MSNEPGHEAGAVESEPGPPADAEAEVAAAEDGARAASAEDDSAAGDGPEGVCACTLRPF